MLCALLSSLLFGGDSQTEEIAQKLSMLQQVLTTDRQNSRTITYDPFYPSKKQSSSFVSHRDKHHKKRHKTVFRPNVTMILNKKAFINGKWYKEKSKIADYVIYKISEDTVFFRKRNKIVTIKLSPSIGILTAKEE